MKALIHKRALELGFDLCRFTTARPPEAADQFQKWLAQGRHGEMGYLQRNAHKRVDPQRVLADAQSIITLAASYHRGGKHELPPLDRELDLDPNLSLTDLRMKEQDQDQDQVQDQVCGKEDGTRVTGRVARYARYADYHDVLAEPLKELAALIDAEDSSDPARSLWYVDTGPLLERDLAQRSGLGFIGKHTNLINRRLGNWIFLAEIITTRSLAPDEPEKNRCGTCSRCLTACPTQAITAPFQLDARLCISYLTIELKGSIPLELRPAIGDRIYGCDDCLEVCPWNRFAKEGRLLKNHARENLREPALLELLALDQVEFQKRFAGTPLLRTKRRGLLRNVCVALGNVGDRSCLPALEIASHDPEPLIAEHAVWAIAQIEHRST